ncbi:MAG: NifB/NifX family molybdenum-iron cluster-binding protein [Alphaproteobacteria bacterium]
MKIAIPMAGGKLANHFGHCETFALLDVNENEKNVLKQESVVPPPHEPGLLPRWLKERNVDLIIAGGMGQRALSLFAENGIKVIVGAANDKPETLTKAYLEGNLETGSNVCDH